MAVDAVRAGSHPTLADHDQFCRVWNDCATLEEFCRRSGLSPAQARNMRWIYTSGDRRWLALRKKTGKTIKELH
jgi:hypothetical protein